MAALSGALSGRRCGLADLYKPVDAACDEEADALCLVSKDEYFERLTLNARTCHDAATKPEMIACYRQLRREAGQWYYEILRACSHRCDRARADAASKVAKEVRSALLRRGALRPAGRVS